MGVYEQSKYPFLTREINFIKKMIEAGKPVLGICLGSQLIAAALGARVYPNKSKEIGWYPLKAENAAKGDFLFSGWPARSRIFQWHGDTFDLPSGAAQLFSSPLCRHQAFRYGENVYGLQFHPEVDAPMIKDWLAHPDADAELKPFGAGKKNEIAKDTRTDLASMSRRAAPVFENFAKLCANGKANVRSGFSDGTLVTAGTI
jgi:GMP synthase-like glutamine amidotransferase